MNAKLTNEQAIAVRRLYANDKRTNTIDELAKQFRCSVGTISNILENKGVYKERFCIPQTTREEMEKWAYSIIGVTKDE